MDPQGRPPRPRTEYDVSITSVPPRAALPRGVLLLLGMAASVVVIGGMKASAGIIAPLFLALVLTVLAHPLRGWLDRWMPSWAASLVCIVVVYLIILVLTLSIVVSAARFATLIPQYTDEMDSRINDLTTWLKSFGVSQEQIQKVASSFDLGRLGGLVTSLLGDLMGVVTNLFFIL